MLGLKSKNMGKQELLGSCLCADIQYVFSSFNICSSVPNYVIYLFIIQLVSNIEGQMLSKDFVCYEIQNDSERKLFFYFKVCILYGWRTCVQYLSPRTLRSSGSPVNSTTEVRREGEQPLAVTGYRC